MLSLAISNTFNLLGSFINLYKFCVPSVVGVLLETTNKNVIYGTIHTNLIFLYKNNPYIVFCDGFAKTYNLNFNWYVYII